MPLLVCLPLSSSSLRDDDMLILDEDDEEAESLIVLRDGACTAGPQKAATHGTVRYAMCHIAVVFCGGGLVSACVFAGST